MAALTFALGLRYRSASTGGCIDSAISHAIATRTAPDPLFSPIVVRLGDPLPILVAGVVLALFALRRGRPRMAALALIGPGSAGVVTVLLKPLIGRTYLGDLAFPSGHTAGITAVSAVIALMAVSFARSSLLTVTTLAATGVLLSGILMAFALLSQGLHYPTDTLGGFATAIVVVLSIALIIDAVPPPDPLA